MEFTDKDRKLMLAIGKRLGAIEVDIKQLKSNASALEQPLKTPTVSLSMSPDIKPRRVAVKKVARPGDSNIEIIFKDKRGNDPKQRVLVESLYKTLKNLCREHNIYTMNIKISNEM